MRPEISKIVRRIFYNNVLQDHSSVEEREAVRGLAQNVFFVQHSQPETSDGSTKSFVNEFEANFAVELCRYLMRHGYKPPQITLLVPYIGQQRKLQETLGNTHGVRLTTVDNYQGEENDIVILCLVRSNEDGSIGFVGTHNRICVALSRARLGFYCFGNFTWLSRKSAKWRAIVNLLTETGEIGPALPLRCHVHGQQTRCAKSPEDLRNISNGGCTVQCNAALPCGHVCQEPCHSDDPDHQKRRKCQQMCLKQCHRGLHSCMYKCSEPCGPCYQRVLRSFAKCGHDWEVRCFYYEHDVCMHPVTARRAQCGRHEVDSTCHFSQCTDSQCTKPGWLRYAGESEKRDKCFWLKSSPCLAEDVFTYPVCGHQVTVSCHVLTCKRFTNCTTPIFVVINGQRAKMICQKFDRINCPQLETKKLPCNHAVPVACSNLRNSLRSYSCPTIVTKTCEACGSKRDAPCGDVLIQADCKGIIKKKLSCGHVHEVECGKQNVTLICTKLVNEPRPGCGHIAERQCCDDAGKNTRPCMELVDRVLDCKHPLKVPCSSSQEAVPRCEVSTMEKQQGCGHYLARPCYDRKNKSMCPSPVRVKRVTCKHEEIVPCHSKRLPLPACTTLVEFKMPNCGHTVLKPCCQPVESLLCDRGVTKPLGCGHKKKMKCCEALEDKVCQKLVARRSPCGHVAKIGCHSISCTTAQCDISIRLDVEGFPAIQGLCHEIRGFCSVRTSHRLALCGHEMDGACSERQSNLVCNKLVDFRLPCGHDVPTLCHILRCDGCDRAISGSQPCAMLKRNLPVCTMEAALRLPCKHTAAVACHVARCAVVDCQTSIAWQGEEAPCCRLRTVALAAECHVKVRVNLPCGHHKDVDCCEAQDCQCDDQPPGNDAEKPNAGALDRVTIEASRPGGVCRMHSCAGHHTRQLDCGHTARVSCRDRLLPVRCNEPIADVVALCGHSAKRACGDETSSSKPICTAERCELWCVHGGCQMRCAEPCQPCTEPCARCGDDSGGDVCGHRTAVARSRGCKHLCFQPCRRAPCSFPCSRPLPCGHECLGLCGEACPALCLECPGPLLERVCRMYSVDPSERFLRLAPCNDVVPVAYMDGHVKSYQLQIDAGNGDTALKPLLCPSCRSPVGCCYRYDKVIKRYFNLKRKVPPGSSGEWIACSRGTFDLFSAQVQRLCHWQALRTMVSFSHVLYCPTKYTEAALL